MECVELCIFISPAHSFFVSQWTNSSFLARPELLVNDILRRVALGTRMFSTPISFPESSFPLISGGKTRALGATISGMRHRCRLLSETGWAESPEFGYFKMVAPKALVFRQLVKGNEDSRNAIVSTPELFFFAHDRWHERVWSVLISFLWSIENASLSMQCLFERKQLLRQRTAFRTNSASYSTWLWQCQNFRISCQNTGPRENVDINSWCRQKKVADLISTSFLLRPLNWQSISKIDFSTVATSLVFSLIFSDIYS